RRLGAAADLADPGPAAGARQALLQVHREEVADLRLERRRHPLPQDGDRRLERRVRGRMEGIDLFGRQRGSLPERAEARGMEDLVAVGVADAGDEGLVPEEALELARVAPNAGPPLVERQRRIVGVGALVGIEARYGTGDPG